MATRLPTSPLILILALAFAGLGASECGEPSPTECAFGAEAHLESVELLECGLGPNGVATCHWQLDFEFDGTYTWLYSDVGEGGHWRCEDGTIIADGGGQDHVGVWDDASQTLTWEGQVYQ